MLETAFLLILSIGGPGVFPDDSLRRAAGDARSAAYRYERLLVSTAPHHYGGRPGDRCDERIGRFCFWHRTPGTPGRPILPDPPEVVAAREAAIHAFRRWFTLAPDNGAVVGPLVRYLIESERASEAAAAARAHVWARDDDAESLLFLGLALHYSGDFQAAEETFDRARATMPEDERRRLDDVSVLLERAESSYYRRLPDEERAAYERAFWALSDTWYLEPGNERRSGHYARHAWSRIHAMAPRVDGRLRWGQDHDEILIRYGLPTGRARSWQPSSLPPSHRPTSLVEWFNPHRLALTPEELATAGIPYAPPTGMRPEIERDTVRSYYAPVTIRRTRGLLVQPSVFPVADGGTVRVDAALPPDTTAPIAPVAPRAIMVILDTLGHELARAPASARVRDDSVTVVFAEQRMPPGSYVYRIEVLDDSTRIGGLAQYRIDVPAPGGLSVSDLLVAHPVYGNAPTSRADASLEPTARLVVPPGQELGLYAEVSGLQVDAAGAAFAVEWWTERAEHEGLLRRAARWVGQRFGIAGADEPTRVGWDDGSPEDAQVVFISLSLDDVDSGLHRVGLLVRDRISGEERSVSRLILVDPAARPLPPIANR